MKKKKHIPYHFEINEENIVSEPVAYYSTPMPVSKQIITKDFLYTDFKKIANRAPFTLADWAEILHVSERTLHRYAKENAAFNGLQTELILLAEKLIDMGNYLFGKEGFKAWLSSSVFSLGNRTPKEFLNSYSGIQEIINVIGRIQHGISA